MQVSSKTIPQKQTGLERQAENNEKISLKSNNSVNIKTLENENHTKSSERKSR